jgi:predicted nuclease of restriction endonuclease-like RecB superfamily
MLTGNLVRARYAKQRIVPYYIDADDLSWLSAAERLLELFRRQDGRTRGELEEDLADAFGEEGGQLVYRGLAKLLEDRCEFEVVSGQPPERLREAVFRVAAESRREGTAPFDENGLQRPSSFDRNSVLGRVAEELGMTPQDIDRGLFADLKGEQRLIRFKDISAERLLQRYNVALAQAVLLRSTRVHVAVRNETPARYRQLLRLVKFHRLICEVQRTGEGCYQLHLDGPLSLFSATQKYGLQLALFLPAVLLCRDFEVNAELAWGPQRRPKTFSLTPAEGLVSYLPDRGTYVPPELGMFAELFRKRVETWDLAEETEVFPLGDGFWVPDFRLTHRATGRAVCLEVLGFWRKSSAEVHLQRLRRHAAEPFILAVSDGLHIDEAELGGLAAGVHRFRQMPLPDEVARLADELIAGRASEPVA